MAKNDFVQNLAELRTDAIPDRTAFFDQLQAANDDFMIGFVVQAFRNLRAFRRIAHRADQPLRFDDRPLLFVEQVNRRQSHVGVGLRKLRQLVLVLIAPVRDRLFEAASLDDLFNGSRAGELRQYECTDCRRTQSKYRFTPVHLRHGYAFSCLLIT